MSASNTQLTRSEIDDAQHLRHRALNDFVFQGENAKRPLSTVGLGNVGPANRLRLIPAAVDLVAEFPEVVREPLLVGFHRHPIHPRRRPPTQSPERSLERLDVHMVQQRREPGLARPCGRVVHPGKMIWEIGPTLCSAPQPLVRVLLILIGGGAWWFLADGRSTPPVAARLSIVVLPFANLSNDPAQDYFADGVTENLTTELSRIRNSFVIARNTAFTFKGKNLDAKAIGKELGVRYVLEGSVQRDQNRVRVNAQLIDAESGAHLWADRFEEDVADMFKLQDEVVARLARTLQIELVNAEAQRSLHDRPRNPDAMDLTMRGLAFLNQTLAKAPSYEARGLFEQALNADPADADALAGAARIDALDYSQGWSDQSVDLYARAMQRANQALLLDPDQATAHFTKARLIMYKTKPNDAASANEIIAEAEATLRADPSFAQAYHPMAVGEMLLGHYEQATSDLERAMRISPRDSFVGLWHMEMGRAFLGLRRTDAAVQEGLKAIDSGYRQPLSYAALAAFYGAADKIPEAKAALAEAMKLNPKLSVAWFDARLPSFIGSPPGFREGLIKAGLPEE